jgi:NAD+ kinase
VANCGKVRAADVLQRIGRKAGELGLALLADPPTARLLPACRALQGSELLDRSDAVMALGGDGTMLRVVRDLDGRDKPVIGVNLGGLGFLTSVAEEQLEAALECLAGDKFLVSVRSVAEAAVLRGPDEAGRYRGLNEVVVGHGPSSRVIVLDVSIDGDHVTSYVCDGVIVSTPTGSTGYSMSAGGPILSPTTPAFVISLICPHTLGSRPLVVPDGSEILIRQTGGGEPLLLTVDGQVGQPLQRGDAVRVRRGDRPVRFIHLPGHSYYAVLRQKLHWSGSNV